MVPEGVKRILIFHIAEGAANFTRERMSLNLIFIIIIMYVVQYLKLNVSLFVQVHCSY